MNIFSNIRFFFNENRETIKVVSGIATAIAGFVLMILSQPLLGLIALSVGLVVFCRTLGGILRSGGYSGESACVFTMGGMGRQQSEASQEHNAGSATETTSAIWDDMTGN